MLRERRFWISNFKAFAEEQEVVLRRITLLFGANSAGKSSILDALSEFSRAIGKNRRDGRRRYLHSYLAHGGEGGFLLGLEVQSSDLIDLQDLPVRGRPAKATIQNALRVFGRLGVRMMRIDLRFDETPGGKSGLSQIRVSAPELRADLLALNVEPPTQVKSRRGVIDGPRSVGITSWGEDRTHWLRAVEDMRLLREGLSEDRGRQVAWRLESPDKSSERDAISWGLDLVTKSRPTLRLQDGRLSPRESNVSSKIESAIGGRDLALCLWHCAQQLMEFSGIGPIRRATGGPHPRRIESPQYLNYDGSNAPDLLAASPALIDRVNAGLERMGFEQRLELIEHEPREVEAFSIRARSVHANSALTLPIDSVGHGLSQVFPVLLGLVAPEGGILSIEQPELHIHPRLQSAFGDVLIAHTGRKRVVVETHSEHLTLRLLRRIGEDRGISEGQASVPPALEAPELGISVLTREKGVSRVHNLRATPDGEIAGEWPGGFFEEREEDLFYARTEL